jgi:hypothetical protein
MEAKIDSCGNDIRQLERFAEAQSTAFVKIVKKFKKWTKSTALGPRFLDGVLGSPASFNQLSFRGLTAQHHNLIAQLRSWNTTSAASSLSASPYHSSRQSSSRQSSSPRRSTSSPQPTSSLQQSTLVPSLQTYWNEYDNGSEAGDDEPYTIYVPSSETFPGSNAIVYIAKSARRLRGWLSPHGTFTERQRLLPGDSYFGQDHEDAGDDDDGTFPTGYRAYAAQLPSIADQRFARHRERLLSRGTLAAFAASLALLLLAATLLVTGKQRLRAQVDAGAAVGVVGALCFAALGACLTLCRAQRVGCCRRAVVAVAFLAVCGASGTLLVLVVGKAH